MDLIETVTYMALLAMLRTTDLLESIEALM